MVGRVSFLFFFIWSLTPTNLSLIMWGILADFDFVYYIVKVESLDNNVLHNLLHYIVLSLILI